MKTIGVLSGLLAVALVGSYLTWTADPEPDEADTVPVYVASVEDLATVAWVGDAVQVTVERKKDELGEYLWITSTEEVAVRDPASPDAEDADEEGEDLEDAEDDGEDEEEDGEDADGADPDAPPARTEKKTVAFLGNDAAEKMWAGFAPLTALRELDAAAAPSPTVFGFDDPEAKVEVTRRSGPLTLTVGGETYGSKDRYVQYDGKVFLVEDASLRPLEHAKTRLVERRLHPLAEQEITALDVSAPQGSLSFVQKNRDDRAAAFWALASSPDTPAELESTWLGKLFRLRVQSYVSQADAPAALAPAFRFDVKGTEASYTVEVLHDAEADEYYARSPFTRGLVALTKSIASDAVEDLPGVIDASK